MTFLMSSYDRPESLWVSLGSLLNQTIGEWECFVLLNHPDAEVRLAHEVVVASISDGRIRSCTSFDGENPAWDCYWSAEWGVENLVLRGKWLCFPSDDTYYCPEFIEEMTSEDSVDLVYCDVLYDKRLSGKRAVLSTAPYVCQVDKTSFMVKANKFIGFPDKRMESVGPSDCDGRALERMVKLGYRHRKVDLCLCVHN